MDEPVKSPLFPVPVRWFEIPLDGMKRGFTHLKKRVDQMIRLDRIGFPASPDDVSAPATGAPDSDSESPHTRTGVGVHLDTYA